MTGFKDIVIISSGKILYLLMLLPIAWILSGFYSIDQNEIAVPVILGNIGDYQSAGIHYYFPYPFGELYIADIKESKTVTVGFGSLENDGLSTSQLNGTIIKYTGNSKETVFMDKNIFNQQFMTGDENIISLEMAVVFNISEPSDWFFNYEEPELLISSTSQTVLFETLSSSDIDSFLVRDPLLEFNLKESIQRKLDDLHCGVQLLGVNFKHVNLPSVSVAVAFRDVKSAEDDRTKRIEDARREASIILTQGKTESLQLQDSAIIKGTEIKNSALTEYELFNKMILSRDLEDQYAYRLYIETMEELLSAGKTFIIDPDRSPDSIYLDQKGN